MNFVVDNVLLRFVDLPRSTRAIPVYQNSPENVQGVQMDVSALRRLM